MEEQKYFVGYAAYAYMNNRTDFLNNVVYIDEEITMELVEKMQADLLNVLNEDKDRYYAVKIISLNKIV